MRSLFFVSLGFFVANTVILLTTGPLHPQINRILEWVSLGLVFLAMAGMTKWGRRR